MKRRCSRAASVLLTVTLLAGCGGDDDPSGPENTISQAEAMAVFSEVLSAVFMVAFSEPPSAPAAMDQIVVDATYTCTNGGSIGLAGTYDFEFDQQGNGSYSYNIVETPNDCAVTGQQGTNFVVNGNPSLHFQGAYDFQNSEPVGTFTMSFTGGLRWTASGQTTGTGSCTINLDYDFNWSTQQGSVTGSICGYSINATY